MNLIDSLVEIFKEEMTAVFKKEAEDNSYLKQNFLGTGWRAFKGLIIIMFKAYPRMYKVLVYAIAKHRLEKHNDTSQEKVMDRALKSMSVEDTEKASSESSWWVN